MALPIPTVLLTLSDSESEDSVGLDSIRKLQRQIKERESDIASAEEEEKRREANLFLLVWCSGCEEEAGTEWFLCFV
ncbi:hypothetical protein Tco_1113312 [Tanacetum coccineum]|uniref:Uncharacterized protein n=1 Tax=Tanacetum coccineum TaxID=301880 RepID=A0ABQ5IS35_9ASTR